MKNSLRKLFFGCKNLLNFICHTLKFHNCHHTSITSLCIVDMDMDMDMAIDRSTNSADRLSRDKAYLTRLGKQLTPRRDISHDRVQKSIKKTTCETIEYLKKREQFWQQLDFRKDEGATHVESYRFLM